MSGAVFGIICLFGLLALLMAFKFPIALALGLSSILTALLMNINLFLLFQNMVSSLNNFGFLALPFFILSANIMTAGGVSDKLMKFANVLVGRITGGTAMVNIVVSMLFGGIQGSSVGDVSSIGALLIPAMVKEGYDSDYSVAVTVTSSVEGIIIPPSQNMIYYSMAAGGVSLTSLFLAGYIPGLLLTFALMFVAYTIAKKRHYPKCKKYALKEGLIAVVDSLIGLFTIVIIIGGITGGIFTPTESAGIATVYAIIVTFFIYKTPSGFKIDDQQCHQGLGFERMFDCFHYESYSEQETKARWFVPAKRLDNCTTSLIGYDKTNMFALNSVSIPKGYNYKLQFPNYFSGLYVLEGEGEMICNGFSQNLSPSNEFFVPACCPSVQLYARKKLKLLHFFGPNCE